MGLPLSGENAILAQRAARLTHEMLQNADVSKVSKQQNRESFQS
jgi:hypothetical protein